MRTTLTIAAATAALATAALAAGGIVATGATAQAPVSAAATRHVEGAVTAVDRSARTLTVRDAERGTLRVRVTATTRFERTTFSSLRTGQRVDVRAKRAGGAWTATKVEPAGAAADDHGGRNGGGTDDGAGHH
jgi:Cu/Ag efflux protein CusF